MNPNVFVDALDQTDLAASHTPATLVQVLTTDGETVDVDAVVDGEVTLDRNSATRSTLDLNVADDGSGNWIPKQVGDLLTPYGNEIQAFRGIAYPDRNELVSLGIFRIDEASIDDSTLEVQVTGLDRSAPIIDATFEHPLTIAYGADYRTQIINLVLNAVPATNFDIPGFSLSSPALIAEEGDDRWAFVQGMAQALGYELYYDRDGTCAMRFVQLAADDPTATYSEGEGGVLIGIGRNWARQDSPNRIVVTGENTGVSGTVPRAVAIDDNPLSPTYYYGPYGKKSYTWSSEYVTTDAQAADAAASILNLMRGATQSINFQSIVDPALDPGDVVQVQRERLGISEAHVIDSVSIPLAASGTMSATSRAVQVQS